MKTIVSMCPPPRNTSAFRQLFEAAGRLAKETFRKKPKQGRCRICGCTERRACSPPCSWANARHDLCSNPNCVGIAELLGIGQQMSNWFYNVKQFERVPQDLRLSGAQLQNQWDYAKHRHIQSLKRGARQ